MDRASSGGKATLQLGASVCAAAPAAAALRLAAAAAAREEGFHHSKHLVHVLPQEAMASVGELGQPRACGEHGAWRLLAFSMGCKRQR